MRAHALASAQALSKRWLVNLMPRCRNLVVRRGRPFRLFRAQQGKAASGVQVLTRRPSLSPYGLMASAHGQAEYETKAEADSDSGKRVTLNCIAGFLDRVGRRVLSEVVLTARHVPYAVTQILDILSDLSNV